MPALTLAEAAAQTGLSTEAIRALARTITGRTPAVAIASDNNPAVSALNVVLGSVGARGGIVKRSKQARPYVSADSAIPSARAVLLDASVPWNFVPRTDAEVFRFAAWDGGSSKANWLLPAPGFLEELSDIPTAPTSRIETYAVAPALSKATHEAYSAADFICSVDSSLPSTEKIIHARCEDLIRGRIGSLRSQEDAAITKLTSAQQVQDQLLKGAIWVGEASETAGWRCELNKWPDSAASGHPEGWASTWPAPVLPPLATKLYRESTLRESPETRNA
jgi:hypothetical protein